MFRPANKFQHFLSKPISLCGIRPIIVDSYIDPVRHEESDGKSGIGPFRCPDAILPSDFINPLERKLSGNAFPLLTRPFPLFMHVIAIEYCLFRGFQRVADSYVDGIDDGDAGGEFVEVSAADKIGDKGIEGKRAQ